MAPGVDIQALVVSDPEKVETIMLRWVQALSNIRDASIHATQPVDWLVMKSKTGEMTCWPISSACAKLRKYWGITIEPVGEVERYESPGRAGVLEAKAVVNATSNLTRERIQRVVGIRRSDESFVGRVAEKDGGFIHDLDQAARTLADSKATRILCGVTKCRPEEVAEKMGIPVEKFLSEAQLGAGFGTAKERAAMKAGKEPGEVGEDAKWMKKARAFWKWLVEDQAAGDVETAKMALKKCSYFETTNKETGEIEKHWVDDVEKFGNMRSPRWLEKTIRTYLEESAQTWSYKE